MTQSPMFVAFGSDAGCGNLVGVQPWLETADYASAGRLEAKLNGYLRAAAERGWLTPKTVVVFPEYTGTWLVAAGEAPALYRAPTIEQGMRRLIVRHLPAYLRALLAARAPDRFRDAVFRFKAPRMARLYQTLFSELAHRYGVTLVAGSIVLPAPKIEKDVLTPGDGPLQNVCVVFRPDGSPHERIVRKAFPIEAEQPFTAPASPADLPTFDTPAGRLAVLICADSWYPEPYAVLKPQRPDLLVVPSFLSPEGAWNRPWSGYDGAPLPADADPADVGRLTEGEAWLKYALAGRIQAAGARCGLNVFLRGRLWDMSSNGRAMVVRGASVEQAPAVDGALLINCWIPGK